LLHSSDVCCNGPMLSLVMLQVFYIGGGGK
jgi:hypothetical protein